MKNGKKLPSFIAGMVTMALVCMLCAPALAANNTQTLQNVRMGGINIVVDGQTIHPTDANGKEVSPLIYNGTTYLPVRAVASALGKAVYWDGPTYTVYLGEMGGTLEYPTAMLKDMTDIGSPGVRKTSKLTDNYGNTYSNAFYRDSCWEGSGEWLLNMKYSRFKATLCIEEGTTSDNTRTITIEADGRQIYTSPAMSKTSAPIQIDLNVTGCNDFKITWGDGLKAVYLADACFYQ